MNIDNAQDVISHTAGVFGTGITWTAIFCGSTSVTAIVALIRAWPILTKIRSEADNSLRADLMKIMDARDVASAKRISELEFAIIEERKRCAAEVIEAATRHQMTIDSIIKRYDHDMEMMTKRHDEQINQLHGEIRGLRDNTIQASKSAAVLLGSTTPVPVSMTKLTGEVDDKDS